MRGLSTKGEPLIARRLLASAASFSLVCLGVVGLAGPAQAAHVTCGQTILVNTTLHADLTCAAGLTIGADNITLDLAGFTVSGGPGPSDGPGIFVKNRTGVTVKNGTVRLWDAGVAVEGGSRNTVTGMRALDNRSGFSDYGEGIGVYFSNNNRITNNQVRNNGPYGGISILQGSFNVIDSNQIADNTMSPSNTDGIRLENIGRNGSNDNIVTNNQITNSALDGIAVFAGGSRNVIRFNQVSFSPRDGITVFAGGNDNVIEGNNLRANQNGIRMRNAAGSFAAPSGNQLLRNFAFGNGASDLRDDQANCGANQWHGNQGANVTPPCTLAP